MGRMGRNLLAAATAAALAAASGDLAGAERAKVVLPMAVADVVTTPAARDFADEVGLLSGGALTIEIRFPGEQTADGEQRIAGEIREGKVAMAWLPTRVWDTQGVPSFSALQTPFLITDYILLGKVIGGSIGRGMLAGTRRVGVRTLGLAAADMRRLLGARRRFVSARDFAGARIRIPSAGSRASSVLLEALGATPVLVASGAGLSEALRSGEVDGAETSFGVVLSNGYHEVARYVAANVVFFPRVEGAVIGEAAFGALTPAERSILARAAARTTVRSLAGLAKRDQQQLRLLCQLGLKAAVASAGQLAGLARAAKPAYAWLERDRATRQRIVQIRALKRETRLGAPLVVPPGCRA